MTFAGVEKHLADIINHIDIEIITPYLICPEEIIPQFKLHIVNTHVTIIPLKIRGIFDFKGILLFLKLLKQIKPQIVNPHLYFASRFASPLAKLMRTPVVIETAHIVERWRKGYKRIFLLWDIITCLFVDRVIAVSNAVAEYYIQYKKLPRSKVEVIHNWCDFEQFNYNVYNEKSKRKKKNDLGIPTKFTLIGLIGRLEEQKGHKYLIHAMPEILKNYPKIKFLFIGDGSLKNELIMIAKDKGVYNDILFLGFRNDIPELLSIIDIIVLPSLFEGLPLTAIEASAMGIPVVASDVDGTPDVIIDGKTGFLFTPCDYKELSDKIIKLLKDKNKTKEMGDNGKLLVTQKFDCKTQINKTQSLYLQTIRNKFGEIF